MKEWYERPRNWILIFLGIVVLGTGITLFSLYMKRYYYSFERQAVKQSLQYREGKTSQIMQLMQEYEKASEGQKKFLIVRISVEVGRVGIENVPVEVQNLIRSMK